MNQRRQRPAARRPSPRRGRPPAQHLHQPPQNGPRVPQQTPERPTQDPIIKLRVLSKRYLDELLQPATEIKTIVKQIRALLHAAPTELEKGNRPMEHITPVLRLRKKVQKGCQDLEQLLTQGEIDQQEYETTIKRILHLTLKCVLLSVDHGPKSSEIIDQKLTELEPLLP